MHFPRWMKSNPEIDYGWQDMLQEFEHDDQDLKLLLTPINKGWATGGAYTLWNSTNLPTYQRNKYANSTKSIVAGS